MKKELCPFGPLLLEARKKKNVTQWHIAVNTGHHVTNISKIEKGGYQPGICLALRMVMAADTDVGAFFSELWRRYYACIQCELPVQGAGIVVDFLPDNVRERRCVFGPLLLAVRLRTGITQKVIAELADYNLRNLGKVEKGDQEPGVITGLTMVAVAGADIASFFAQFAKLLVQEES